MSRSEFLKAVRALSVRYVERRAELGTRSPVDSAGKRAAFAAYYAPLHFLTVREILRVRVPEPPRLLVDGGCGTGVSSAAWALECVEPPDIHGVDLDAWSLEESRWNWRTLGLRGRTTRGDLVHQLEALAADRKGRARSIVPGTGVILGWSLNELDSRSRVRGCDAVLRLAKAGIQILIVEPIANRAVPWWTDWLPQVEAAGGRAAEWRFDINLPPRLAEIDEAVGFRREALTARTVEFSSRTSKP